MRYPEGEGPADYHCDICGAYIFGPNACVPGEHDDEPDDDEWEDSEDADHQQLPSSSL